MISIITRTSRHYLRTGHPGTNSAETPMRTLYKETILSSHSIIYHQFVRVRVSEEPRWQGSC